jgi:diguanylate cyclase (GGDEF)-like protein
MAFILVAEPSGPVSGALRRFLESAGHEVVVVTELPEALSRVRELAPAVVIASCTESFEGEKLCRQVKEEGPGIPVLLLYLPEEEQPEARAAGVGAEGCLVGPLKRATVVSCVGLLLQLARAREEVAQARLEQQLHAQGQAAAAPAPPPSPSAKREITGSSAQPDLEFLKRLLFMEVKRSRRYRDPISFLLVEPDKFAERTNALPATQRTSALAEMLRRITEGLRDIDLAVPFAEGRFIIFLPHTPYEGAMVVAERLLQRVKEVMAVPGLTASLGLAVFEPSAVKGQSQVSFGSLLKEAGDALRRAQAAGGDRIESTRALNGPSA